MNIKLKATLYTLAIMLLIAGVGFGSYATDGWVIIGMLIIGFVVLAWWLIYDILKKGA